ncbi:MAG: cation:proton antiporter [Candidatus Altiarchaeota archaeon]|nr:cation:proton antiporter [Candidatus Altiarchaeota archaeon]
MRKKLKKIRGTARSYAKYIIVGLAVLLFFSVIRASVFDQYLFGFDGISKDVKQQERLINHVRATDARLANLLEGASFIRESPEDIRIIKDEKEVAVLEIDGETCLLETEDGGLEIGSVKDEGGKINVYASTTPEEEKIWFEISFILLVAISAEFLVVYVKQPAVMVLLLLGIIISPSAISLGYPYIASGIGKALSLLGINIPLNEYIPHLVPTEEGSFISIFAKLGSIFLLFKVGLHSEISKIFNSRNFIVAFAGVIVPFVGGYYYATLTGHGFAYSMFLGAALTATSVGVTVAVLEEFKVLDREFAKIVLGAAVIDDILSLLALSLVKNLPADPSGLDPATLMPFVYVLVTAAVFVVGGIKLGQYIVKRYFNRSPEEKLTNATFLGILVYVLSYSYVAEFIGLSAIVGAFLAGVTLNYSKMIHRIFELFYPLEAFFTPIFFISLGMYVDIPALVKSIEPIIIITLIAVATKILSCGLATRLTKGSWIDSLIVGIGMVPRGEVALIIGFYGLTATTLTGEPILTGSEYAVIASMAFLTTVIIPLMLQKSLSHGGYKH